MSDDEEEMNENQPEMFGVPLPPALVNAMAHMQEHVDHHQMENESWRHEVIDFISSLSVEHLELLHDMFHSITVADSDTKIAISAYYEGIIVSKRERFGICIACGKNHDEEFAKMTSEGEPVLDMADYNLEYLDPESHGGLLRCKGCGIIYTSVAERASAGGPDKSNCRGCVSKEKWG
ncbi:MAG TPA: hypothetical protein VIY48_19010 [Candidatus Paceibacterota bacterium]